MMAVGLKGLPELFPVPGIRLGTTAAGIRKPGRLDLVIMEVCAGAQCAAVFTRNAFCAAPVIAAKQHLTQASPRYLIINTGCANAGTGEQGLIDALACCDGVAHQGGTSREQVLPFSTGVIGERLPVEKIHAGLGGAFAGLDAAGWAEAATGIMTTDTVPKGASRRVEIDGYAVTVTGIAKGSGMIHPNMATMLAFVATDANIAPELLQQSLRVAVAGSFNRITVDGDTSTNDACILIATGKSGIKAISDHNDPHYALFMKALTEVCTTLAQAIIRDGEGATKFITINVQQGANEGECTQVAYAIAHSPLVKTAFFAGDPNWGRILAAVGYAGLQELDISRVNIYLDDVCIVRNGGRAPDYQEQLGRTVMQRDEITVRVLLGRGQSGAKVWTCDFSYDYVKINAEYRT